RAGTAASATASPAATSRHNALIPKVIDIDPFHGGHSARRAGAVRGAMCHPRIPDGGQAPPKSPWGTRRAEGPHPPGRALYAASGVAQA
ncbi:MAG: hypothetical protein O7I42_24215, partial [Alphaproteobacteria bacterium]|nr:hypothetical protein [Alphaproteobacteria bacterium]